MISRSSRLVAGLSPLLLMTLLCSTHCASSDEDLPFEDDIAESEDALVGGTISWARPEIGAIYKGAALKCTATLVSDQIAITAAHCVNYFSGRPAVQYRLRVTKRISRLVRKRYEYTVDRVKSFGSDLGRDDIALLHLENAVPSTVASAAKLARERPPIWETKTAWGYGCTNQETKEGAGPKRYRRYGASVITDFNCPGDSGGPRTRDDKSIFEINSFMDGFAGGDGNADVVHNLDAIRSQIAAWGGGGGGAGGGF